MIQLLEKKDFLEVIQMRILQVKWAIPMNFLLELAKSFLGNQWKILLLQVLRLMKILVVEIQNLFDHQFLVEYC